ncbi:MAG: prephenate dehydrogenase/arogenate dehydrogenase family protein [Pseudomonadales bacterium]|nr:prephenate dehydrogenase/arogenate dehydrogenase family protein [Pseudomonadales bacterium]MBL6814648.1 prephenate dehydrogenase/arogenate dehydrogenase family protein [Pseudomonadales bacterium]
MNLQTLAIVGVGLIGGSIGKAAKERGIAAQIVGIEANAASAEWALANGLIDRVADVVPEQANLIALCVPSDLVSDWVVKLADHRAPMFDVGSVKGPIVEAIAARQSVPGQFLPCHPISGSEKSGPQAADATLFDGCTLVMTPLEHTTAESQRTCTEFWQALGALVVRMSPQDHDAALAATSHLPHLLAFAYMAQVSDEHLPLTGGGFRDFTRIAAANPELWWRIMRLNRGALSEALDDYSQNLAALVSALEQGDEATGLALIRAAARKRQAADQKLL